MVKASVYWKWIAAVAFLCGTVLLSSPGFCESLKDGVILRDNADLFLKDGSVVPCRRIVWLVEAADFVQCDQGDHAVEIKIEDLLFEKTFGPAMAREYAEMKGDLVDAHEKSRRQREAGAVTYESAAEPGMEQGPASSGPAELPQAAPEGDAGKGAPPEDLDDAMKTLKGDTRPSKAFNTARAIAQQARGGTDCTQAIPLLIEKLDDGRLVMVVSSFGGFGGASTTQQCVGDAVKHALVSIGRPAVPALIQRVKAIRPGSGGAGDRQAILALGEIGDDRAVDVLARHAQNADLAHRRDAIRSLSQIGGGEAWQGLTAVLASRQLPVVRLEAAWGLHRMDKGRAAQAIDPHIDGLLADPDSSVKRSAINLAGECGFKRLAPRLAASLDHNDPMVIFMALGALAKVGAPADTLPRIMSLAGEKRHSDVAARAIQAVSDPASVQGLIGGLAHGNAKVRQASARALGGIGRPEAAPALVRALSDENLETRFQALEALGKIPGPEATEAIRAFAEGGDHKLAPRARHLLQNR